MPILIESELLGGLAALESGYLCCATVSPHALDVLRRRRVEIEMALQPAPRRTIITVLGSLGNMQSAKDSTPEEASAFVKQDIEDLADISAWALEAAARAFRRGEIGEGKWRPTAGELRKEARRRETYCRAELLKLRKLLDAPALNDPRPVYVDRERVESLKLQLAAVGKWDAGEPA